jgi:hypothetical protein
VPAPAAAAALCQLCDSAAAIVAAPLGSGAHRAALLGAMQQLHATVEASSGGGARAAQLVLERGALAALHRALEVMGRHGCLDDGGGVPNAALAGAALRLLAGAAGALHLLSVTDPSSWGPAVPTFDDAALCAAADALLAAGAVELAVCALRLCHGAAPWLEAGEHFAIALVSIALAREGDVFARLKAHGGLPLLAAAGAAPEYVTSWPLMLLSRLAKRKDQGRTLLAAGAAPAAAAGLRRLCAQGGGAAGHAVHGYDGGADTSTSAAVPGAVGAAFQVHREAGLTLALYLLEGTGPGDTGLPIRSAARELAAAGCAAPLLALLASQGGRAERAAACLALLVQYDDPTARQLAADARAIAAAADVVRRAPAAGARGAGGAEGAAARWAVRLLAHLAHWASTALNPLTMELDVGRAAGSSSAPARALVEAGGLDHLRSALLSPEGGAPGAGPLNLWHALQCLGHVAIADERARFAAAAAGLVAPAVEIAAAAGSQRDVPLQEKAWVCLAAMLPGHAPAQRAFAAHPRAAAALAAALVEPPAGPEHGAVKLALGWAFEAVFAILDPVAAGTSALETGLCCALFRAPTVARNLVRCGLRGAAVKGRHAATGWLRAADQQ